MSDSRREQFLSAWPPIRDELVQYMQSEKMPSDATAWYKQVLDHNTPGGKLNRGMSVVDTVEILQGSKLEGGAYQKAAMLGWCIELLQAYFLVADDIMDQSITRRGQPCWYKMPGVGNIAINDAFMLEAAIYFLLKKHFRQERYYVDLLELFHETTFQTEFGQLIDLLIAPEDHVDLARFSLEKHHLIVVYKTAFYSFYLPVALAMHMAGVSSPHAFAAAKDILLPLGEYFQVQDDYLDCYGDPKTIGKIGTDILDNKCSWNINVALQVASKDQRQTLEANYGRLPGRFAKYENDSYTRLTALIDALDESTGLKRAVFTSFLTKVYKRQA